MAAKKKIGPKKIINKMTLGDAIHAVEADYPGTVFYVGSESSYFFIGTAEEFDNDISGIDKEYKAFFKREKAKKGSALKDMIIDNYRIRTNDELMENVSDRQDEIIRTIQKACRAYDASTNWVDIEKRTVKQCYVRDPLGEFNDGGLVMIVPGYENGKWAFYHEYKSKTIQYEPNTVYIPPKEENE